MKPFLALCTGHDGHKAREGMKCFVLGLSSPGPASAALFACGQWCVVCVVCTGVRGSSSVLVSRVLVSSVLVSSTLPARVVCSGSPLCLESLDAVWDTEELFWGAHSCGRGLGVPCLGDATAWAVFGGCCLGWHPDTTRQNPSGVLSCTRSLGQLLHFIFSHLLRSVSGIKLMGSERGQLRLCFWGVSPDMQEEPQQCWEGSECHGP